MTEDKVTVSSDSRAVGNDCIEESIPKIWAYSDNMVFYGLGTVRIFHTLFKTTDIMKNDGYDTIEYNDAVQFLRAWKNDIEKNPPFSGISSILGVCCIHNQKPISYAVNIFPKSGSPDDFVISPKLNRLTYRIFPPEGLDEKFCNNLFKQKIDGTSCPITVGALLSASKRTVESMCSYSDKINSRVQYWGYDVLSHQSISELIGFAEIK